jgi:hypothetical protein
MTKGWMTVYGRGEEGRHWEEGDLLVNWFEPLYPKSK